MRNVGGLRSPHAVTARCEALEGAVRDWRYAPSAPSLKTRLKRGWRLTAGRRPAPPWTALTPVSPAERWIAYFLFLPDGVLTPAHQFTLDRLRREPARLALICASPGGHAVLDQLATLGDALYWKDLAGFDFSAYAIALGEVGRRSAGAELIILNDSVFGPFTELCGLFDRAPWDMAGLTGASYFENHVQSYAWRVRSVGPGYLAGLRPVLGGGFCFDRFDDVVMCQETRLARAASRHGTVGALWFSDYRRGAGDLTLEAPMDLLDAGFPFLKRSLTGKLAHMADQRVTRERLRRLQHPVPGPT